MNLKDAAANLNQAHPEDILHPLYTLWGNRWCDPVPMTISCRNIPVRK